MNTKKAEKFIQNKLDTIENTIEEIRGAASVLVNAEGYTDKEIEQELTENFGERFHVSDIVKEWNDYARITYLRMQVAKNSKFVPVAMLNATIFVQNFLEKFLKF